jgi:membrane-associated phospholipid phosphatase
VLALPAWIIALAVGWARVKTRNHTTMQVLAGFAAATVVVAAATTLVP